MEHMGDEEDEKLREKMTQKGDRKENGNCTDRQEKN